MCACDFMEQIAERHVTEGTIRGPVTLDAGGYRPDAVTICHRCWLVAARRRTYPAVGW
jgi:hypothetical protein